MNFLKENLSMVMIVTLAIALFCAIGVEAGGLAILSIIAGLVFFSIEAYKEPDTSHHHGLEAKDIEALKTQAKGLKKYLWRFLKHFIAASLSLTGYTIKQLKKLKEYLQRKLENVTSKVQLDENTTEIDTSLHETTGTKSSGKRNMQVSK